MAADAQGLGIGSVVARDVLSEMYQSVHTTILPFYTHLLRVCPSGTCQTWSVQGHVACGEKDTEMPSMGRQWLRPGTVISAGRAEE